MSKTTQQAFNDLRNAIIDAIPKSLIDIAKVSKKYMLLTVVCYSLAVYMIYIGEYPSAIISSLLGIISIR